IDQEDADWMAAHLCSRTCPGVFVRGTVVAKGGLLASLQLVEISSSSKAIRAATASDMRPVAPPPLKPISPAPAKAAAAVPAAPPALAKDAPDASPAPAEAATPPSPGGGSLYISVKASQFASKAQGLLGKNVELGGAFRCPMLIHAGDTSLFGG